MNTSTSNRRRPACRTLFLLAVLLAATPWSAAGAQTGDAARNYFTDVELLTHDGEEVRLYSDLMEGKTVIISAFFTTCAGVCPVTAANLQKVQKALGPRLGKDVYMLSFTVDPEVDNLAKLKEYAGKVKAQPGWYFLTGEKENLEFALKRLGLYTTNKDAHSPLFLIGNVPTGLWKKAMGMAQGAEVIKIVESVLDDQLEPATDAPVRPGR